MSDGEDGDRPAPRWRMANKEDHLVSCVYGAIGEAEMVHDIAVLLQKEVLEYTAVAQRFGPRFKEVVRCNQILPEREKGDFGGFKNWLVDCGFSFSAPFGWPKATRVFVSLPHKRKPETWQSSEVGAVAEQSGLASASSSAVVRGATTLAAAGPADPNVGVEESLEQQDPDQRSWIGVREPQPKVPTWAWLGDERPPTPSADTMLQLPDIGIPPPGLEWEPPWAGRPPGLESPRAVPCQNTEASVTEAAASLDSSMIEGFEAAISWSSDRNFSILMPSRKFTDEHMRSWCVWFKGYMNDWTGPSYTAENADFSKNDLTGEGVKLLLDTMLESRTRIRVLKLHQNGINDGTTIAQFIRNSQGALRELHLSHNQLDTEAAWHIVYAAAMTKDHHGRHSYPWSKYPHTSTNALWLRLEQNSVQSAELLARISTPEHQERFQRPARQVMTQVEGQLGCSPLKCRCPGGVPAIHMICGSNTRQAASSRHR